jgi:hypothetical protein
MKKIKVTVGLYCGHFAKENITNVFLSFIRNDFEMFRPVPVLATTVETRSQTTAPGLSSDPKKTDTGT